LLKDNQKYKMTIGVGDFTWFQMEVLLIVIVCFFLRLNLLSIGNLSWLK